MADFDNTNKGVLFINEDRKSNKHPHYKGSFTDSEGTEFWVSGWKKLSKNDQKYISLSFTPKETEDDEDEDDFDEPVKKPAKKGGKSKPSKKPASQGDIDDLPF